MVGACWPCHSLAFQLPLSFTKTDHTSLGPAAFFIQGAKAYLSTSTAAGFTFGQMRGRSGEHVLARLPVARERRFRSEHTIAVYACSPYCRNCTNTHNHPTPPISPPKQTHPKTTPSQPSTANSPTSSAPSSPPPARATPPNPRAFKCRYPYPRSGPTCAIPATTPSRRGTARGSGAPRGRTERRRMGPASRRRGRGPCRRRQ